MRWIGVPVILPDINVLVYAHRKESPRHAHAAEIVTQIATALVPFALSSFVCNGFIRIVTNHRIYREPTPLKQALVFVESLIARPNCRQIEPSESHWLIFKQLLQETKATGNLVSDAYLAAIAIEHGCEILTDDSDFSKFSMLKVQKL